ncbi:AraC family transcriptional regulator [Cyclobacterium plantarum]|uniref:AraC family transcriptional regulator n=1 Tax=Cyclobacterium plantarum TaxID=2716263 RepID=UPI003F727184
MNANHTTLAKSNTKNGIVLHKMTIFPTSTRFRCRKEIELVIIKKGTGNLYLENNSFSFAPGEVFVFGPMLPHRWSLNGEYGGGEIEYIYFNRDFWGKKFLCLPENKVIKTFLDLSEKGIKIAENEGVLLSEIWTKILLAEGSMRVVYLMEMLSCLAYSHGKSILTLHKNKKNYYVRNKKNQNKIEKITSFSEKNFYRKIQLTEVSRILGMNQNYFCKFFKTETGKTYFQYLSEIRVSYSCKLLDEGKDNFKQICFKSGFNNLTSFYKTFKKVKGKTPKNYQNDRS